MQHAQVGKLHPAMGTGAELHAVGGGARTQETGRPRQLLPRVENTYSRALCAESAHCHFWK